MRLSPWSPALLLLTAFCSGAEQPAEGAPGNGSGGDASVDAPDGDAGEPCPTEPDIRETPPPDPGAPVTAPTLDCGTPTFDTSSGLRRHPYLQSASQTSLMVAWTMTAGSNGLVRVAESSSGPWTEFAAASELFDTTRTGDTVDYVAFAAALTSLEPNRAYCYEVWADGAPVATGLRFDTAWSGAERPVRMLAFGDSGKATPEQYALRDQFMTEEYDVFLHLGDMAYDSGKFPEFEERVFDAYRDLLHRVPTFPTIGNHEYKTDDAQPYLDVYYLFEQALRAEDQERYYSFDYGNVHFVSLDSNAEMLLPIQLDFGGTVDDDMIDWLDADLAASSADWKIAFFHHPPFSQYDSRGDNSQVINVIMPALERGGVDLVLLGHDHHYVRSLPVRGECRVPGGARAIPYVVVGSGGTGLTEFGPDADTWYVAQRYDQKHAYLSFTVHGCKGTGVAIDIDGNAIDSFELNGCD